MQAGRKAGTSVGRQVPTQVEQKHWPSHSRLTTDLDKQRSLCRNEISGAYKADRQMDWLREEDYSRGQTGLGPHSSQNSIIIHVH